MPRRAFFWPARTESDYRADPTQKSLARRALVEPAGYPWRHRALAGLAVAVLGLGTAGSVVLTGNAERPLPRTAAAVTQQPSVERSIAAGVTAPKAFSRTAAREVERATRDSSRPALSSTSGDLTRLRSAARTRSAELAQQAAAVEKRAEKLAKQRAERRAEKRAEKRAERKKMLGDGKATLPVPGARVAAGFGATGAWARYHTGIDFSAGSGTAIHAPRAGTVTTAGSGRASGWAGTYVTIKHSDGTSSLYAHMSSVEVSEGDEVSAGRVIGRVGQTGRAFGPHLHFEIYPAGVEPGDVYNAVDPWPWLHDLGLRSRG